MAGFKTDGDVSFGTDESVVFLLKSSSGATIKSYKVESSKADEFEKAVTAEEESLRKDAGEKDPLRLVRIQKVF